MLSARFSQAWFLFAFPTGMFVGINVGLMQGLLSWLAVAAFPHLVYFFYKRMGGGPTPP
mgnify:CR=1 FL=1